MRNQIRFLCMLLCLVMIVPLFASCNKNGKPVHVVKGGESDYTIIYSRTASAAEKQAATALRDAIEEKTGVKLKLETDNLSDKQGQILVGTTNRSATAEVLNTIREKDFAIAYREGRIIIAGGNEAATVRAVNHFIKNNINEKKARVTVYTKDYIDEFDYMLGELKVDGTPLADYTIIYPADAPKLDKVVYYAAINLQDFFLNNAGIKLNVKSDAAGETANEILVGKTNRTASGNAQHTVLAEDEYILYKDGSKIVMMGNSLMVAAAAGAFANDSFAPTENKSINATVPTTATPAKFTFKKATSAILMVGDGMGPKHIIAGVEAGKTNLAQNQAAEKCADMFVADLMPYKAMCTTASQSVIEGLAQFTDSAAAATALATGYKTYNYYVGSDKNGTKLTSLRDLANSKGAKTAILTTAAITDATPAAFLAHATDRYDETIQSQIDALLAAGNVTVAEGDTNDLSLVKETDLLNRVRNGLAAVSESNSSFFAMIEEAHIDKFSHKVQGNKGAQLYDVQNSVLCYNEAIAYTIAFVMMHPDTALIVTADHECGNLTISEKTGSMQYDFFSNDHTNTDVPVWGMGYGVENLLAGKTTIDNTDIPKFIATIYGEANFGQQ